MAFWPTLDLGTHVRHVPPSYSVRVMKPLVLATLLVLTIGARAGAIEVVAAGDIATSGSGDLQTSNRVLALDPAVVLTLGDNAYPSGTLAQYNSYYDPTWGRFKSITRPSPGNHDWMTTGAAGYESYFGVPAGEIRSFVVGDWRVISMDSNVSLTAQNGALASALESDGHRCELRYFHAPRWSSGTHGNEPAVAPWWTTAYTHGVDLILNGHDHDYERFNKKAPSGAFAGDGIREFVVGTGGVATRPFGSIQAGSQKRITGNANWGVLDLDLAATSYSWRFVDADS
jgi:hypothetical protein